MVGYPSIYLGLSLTHRVWVLDHPDDERHDRRGDKHKQDGVVERLGEQDAESLHGDLGKRIRPVRLAKEIDLSNTSKHQRKHTHKTQMRARHRQYEEPYRITANQAQKKLIADSVVHGETRLRGEVSGKVFLCALMYARTYVCTCTHTHATGVSNHVVVHSISLLVN